MHAPTRAHTHAHTHTRALVDDSDAAEDGGVVVQLAHSEDRAGGGAARVPERLAADEQVSAM